MAVIIMESEVTTTSEDTNATTATAEPQHHHDTGSCNNITIEHSSFCINNLRDGSCHSMMRSTTTTASASPIGTTNISITPTKIKSNEEIIWNLSFCFLAWACNVSTFTIVIGTSNNVLLSIGGNVNIASIPLGAFFLGSALISCGITEPVFRICGRKYGFIVGIVLGLIATVLGSMSLIFRSPILNIVSTFFFGTSNGIGYFLRFAVIENVPKEWAERAVTIVVSGGIIAAFVGPEAGHAIGGIFGSKGDTDNNINDNMYYIGIFLITAIFNVASLLCIAIIPFQPITKPETDLTKNKNDSTGITIPVEQSKPFIDIYKALLSNRHFLIPMLRATMSWIIMVVPMSVLRIAMRDAGYSTEQSLRAIELHFCGMYAPGFISGPIIQKYGVRIVALVGFLISCITISILTTSRIDNNDGSSNEVIQWIVGMFLLGVGWNFQFTSTTVWLNQTVDILHGTCCSKGQIQSANDFLMFFISGIGIFGASFVYDAGMSDDTSIENVVLRGWMTLMYYVISFLAIDLIVVLMDYCYYLSTTPSKNVSPTQGVDEELAIA